MTFDNTERASLAALADELIPAGEGLPCASEADVSGSGLDRVLAVRPELGEALKQVLDIVKGRPAKESVAELKADHLGAFMALTECVAGAYFLNPQVRAGLGYHGQIPHPIDPKPDFRDDDLLQSVMDRGRIYRPTPPE